MSKGQELLAKVELCLYWSNPKRQLHVLGSDLLEVQVLAPVEVEEGCLVQVFVTGLDEV